ncbi:MAG: 2-C-methyl-D-erythritol 2,4-cyclodiphosphate synthase, partial [Thiomonas sp.]
QQGWTVGNIDCTVIAQAPKLAPYRAAIRLRIAELLGLDGAQVNIKGKTTERLGFVGRGEGIAASAVCLLQRD